MRLGVAAMINSQEDMTVIGQAGNVEDAVRVFQEKNPDLVLMDLRLPDASGVTAIRRIVAIAPQVRIVVLTTYEGDEDIHQALAAGAMGYIVKGMSRRALIDAVRRVQAGQKFLPSVVNDTLSSRTPASVLTQREQEVLKLMFRGKSNREIADLLQIRETTAKTHVSVVLTKLNVEDRTQAVVEGLKRGLIHL
ncbi:two component transcriptional regulator, LuxR family [Granulicella rosea]|uniref:Two component transcriptional regulator, LuxR family n=2 Tax=Granulicella rosea TaxID=474952 RepID=A0A239K4K9_9BACT|nr:two component transcriptional regulator, LuxR family [Granulicella rosea]